MAIIKSAKIWKSGGSFVVTIPMDYVENGLLTTEETYEIDIRKVKP